MKIVILDLVRLEQRELTVNEHLTMDEGKKLIKKYDGEFPKRYFDEIIKYYGIKINFHKLCDKFRSPHLWKKIKKNWKLRHTANMDGTDD